MMEKIPLKVALRAVTDLDLLSVPQAAVEPFLTGDESEPEGKYVNWSLLRQLALFREMPLQQLEAVVTMLQPRDIQPGEALIEQGHPASALYIIQSGRFEVVTVIDGKVQQIASLGAGEVCGEQSLLSGNTASATVRAQSGATVLRLDAHSFNTLIHDNQSTMSRLEQVSSRRRLTTREPLTLSQN
jgi:CRP-like cAMP-binding protein